MKSIGTELSKEQARCRGLLGVYHEIGQPGIFAAMLIEQALERADQSAIAGDIVGMIRCYEELKLFKA